MLKCCEMVIDRALWDEMLETKLNSHGLGQQLYLYFFTAFHTESGILMPNNIYFVDFADY